jgi:glycosyltransferase involved in cell wall biosynthesis
VEQRLQILLDVLAVAAVDVAVDRLVPVKGVNHLVTAVEDAVEEGCDVLLDIVGTGKEERALREQVATTSVSSRVSFHGFVPFGPELFELYRQADAFVLFSYSEGFPNVLLESMANGTPVITTNVGGIDEVIVDGETGLLVDPGNIDALTDAIIRLAADDELCSRLVHAGLDTAHQYTVEQQEQKLVDVLKKEFPDVTLE